MKIIISILQRKHKRVLRKPEISSSQICSKWWNLMFPLLKKKTIYLKGGQTAIPSLGFLSKSRHQVGKIQEPGLQTAHMHGRNPRTRATTCSFHSGNKQLGPGKELGQKSRHSYIECGCPKASNHVPEAQHWSLNISINLFKC